MEATTSTERREGGSRGVTMVNDAMGFTSCVHRSRAGRRAGASRGGGVDGEG